MLNNIQFKESYTNLTLMASKGYSLRKTTFLFQYNARSRSNGNLTSQTTMRVSRDISRGKKSYPNNQADPVVLTA